MISNKNNELGSSAKGKLSKIHNGNNKPAKKLRLYAFRNQSCIKTYHPLKQKRVKLRQLKILAEEKLYGGALTGESVGLKNNPYNVMCKKYSITRMDKKSDSEYCTEDTVFEWLLSIGVEISRIKAKQYILRNRICTFNSVLIFANKKRIDMGLKPFLIEDLIEDFSK